MKFIFILLAFSLPLLAEDFTFDKESGQALPNFIAQLKVARGKIYKSTGGEKKLVKTGTRFYKNDTLITDVNSYAQLLIVDDSVVTLGAKSELKFEDFKFVDKTDRQIVYSFIKGQIRGLIKNKAKEGDIVFKTKLAVMGIRGTEILINHHNVKNLEVSEFALLSGNTLVTEDKNQNHELSKHDRIIIVQDPISKQSANDKNKLSEAEVRALIKKDRFLDFVDLNRFDKTSAIYPFLQAEATKVNSDTEAEPSVKENDKNWRDNLRKLNEKLKEYQTISH
jgi:hypothetical protein